MEEKFHEYEQELNRREIRPLLRSPIYEPNEIIEMELETKKISQLNKKCKMIGKIVMNEGQLHNEIFKKANKQNTRTIKY